MSQTKATKIIKAFHDNDLFSSTLKAILENDDQLFLDAVKKANLTVDDLTLSDAEFDDLVKGTKPSGELDIITWDGYYEVDAGSETDPRAFLILSTTENVYWGSRSQLMSAPGNYVVNYSLTPDGKLIFSTPTDGSVSISLSRTFDDTTGTTSVKVSGVCNGQSFSGGQVSSPLESDSETPTKSSIKRTPLASQTVTIRKDSLKVDADLALTWQDICTIVGTGIAVVTAFGFFYQVYLWIKEAGEKRAERGRMLLTQIDEKANLIEVVVEEGAKSIDVNWDSAWKTLTNDITSRINQKLADVDFMSQTPDEIVESLRETARESAIQSLDDYVQHRIGSQILERLDPFRSLPSYQDIKAQIMNESVAEQVRPKLRDIGSDASTYDPLIRSLTLEARQRAFLDNYETLSKAYNGAESAYEDARKKREDTEHDIEDVDEKIEEAQEANNQDEVDRQEERKRELEDELNDLKTDEEAKNEAKDEALREKNEAADQSRDADNDVNEDHSGADWDHKGEGVFG